MQIRPATKYDVTPIYLAFKELNKSHVDYFNRNRVKWLIKNKCVAVVTSSVGTVLGACAVEDKYGDLFEIFAISVRPEYHGLGVGTKLIKWAEAMARACDREIIFADSYKFYGATPFYTRLGYHRQDWEGYYTFYKYV